MATRDSNSRRPWSRLEVEAVVADYFQMLSLELSGQQYKKAAHSRALMQKLDNRSSVDFKHQNISAILIELGAPWIDGYKPMGNYQALLLEVVTERLLSDAEFDAAATSAVERPAMAPEIVEYSMRIPLKMTGCSAGT